MPRRTQKDLDQVVANLNRRLEFFESPNRVSVSYRYDYHALDECDLEGNEKRLLVAGTKGEVYDAAWHMICGIDLIGR